MRVGILRLWLLTAVACSPAQRAIVGGVIGTAGLGVAGSSIDSMVFPSCRLRDDQHHDYCVEYNATLSPKEGLPLLAGGLGVALLGGVLLVTALPSEPPPTKTPIVPASPDRPVVLNETDAVGMAVAQLVLVGLDSESKPSRLLGVDQTQVRIIAKDRRAELWNLRIRTVADETWRSVGACYEYEHEWRLKSLGTTSGCPP